MIRSAAATSPARPVCSAMTAAPDSRRPPSASSAAPRPPAAPAPGSARTSRPVAASSSSAQSVSRRSSSVDGGRVGALLRAEDVRRPHRARAAGVRRRWRRSGRRRPAAPRRRRARRARRPGRGRRRCRRCRRARRRCGAAPASQRGVDAVGRLPCCARRRRSAPWAGRRAAASPQACAHSTYAVADAGVEHPLGGDLGGQRTADTRADRRPPNRLASTSTKPGPPSDCGASVSWSSAAPAPPAGGDGLGGLHGGEAVAVAVRGDQHAQRVARHPSRVSAGVRPEVHAGRRDGRK